MIVRFPISGQRRVISFRPKCDSSDRAMDAPAPELDWMDREYFTRVLEAYLHADVTVERFELTSGAPVGQNFMSAIVRATVQYRLASTQPNAPPDAVSLIVKTKLSNAELAEEVDQLNVFGIEKTVYGPVLKAVRELLTSFGDCTQFAPRFIYEDEHALVLEDLTVKGYRQPDRKARLDQAHMRLIVQKLAKFHAATAVLGRKNRDLFNTLASSSFNTEGNPVHLFYANAIQQCIEQTRTVPELNPYTEFLSEFLDRAIEREAKSYEREEGGFHVLNHGDMWLNNLLWRYDAQGAVVDVIMVDYQESFYGSPAFDLNHLLYTSANSAIQRAGFDELVQLYTDALQGALQTFKYDGPLPNLDTVRTAMDLKRDHALTVTTCIVPALILERSELATPENMLGDHEEAVRARAEIFSNPKFIEILCILLPRLAAGTASA
uniref:CHK kinase-like domain-containing protein n=1 Tax=Anopheles farauti TaxID=69004 RepID=A0A182QKN3_9DIPT